MSMTYFDVFNGDADGLCSLQQLRLNEPLESSLITGLKRDINLFSQFQAKAGDSITALDISFDKNRDGVRAALAVGARVFYADHHYPGELVESDQLDLHIHTDANTCTSLIINDYLQDKYVAWALAGAYGDNLYDSAEALAERFHVSHEDRESLKQLGTLLNYNGYGFVLEDLIFHPAELFRKINPFENPLGFTETADYRRLFQAYQQDIANTTGLMPHHAEENGAIFVLPNEAWARRVNGVFSNDLARTHPSRAHAVLVECENACYRVSVRAPLERKTGADELCRQFASGGGRKAAAGINELPKSELNRFAEKFFLAF